MREKKGDVKALGLSCPPNSDLGIPQSYNEALNPETKFLLQFCCHVLIILAQEPLPIYDNKEISVSDVGYGREAEGALDEGKPQRAI